MNKPTKGIIVPIKYGKNIRDAEFVIMYVHGNIVCLSMYIDGIKQSEHTQENYFRTNHDKIKKQFFKLYGEIA